MIAGIQEKVRPLFDIEAIRAKFPFAYTKSMNVVLVQEIARYNSLLEVIHSSSEALALALEGLVVTTTETEATLDSLLSNQVPARWRQRAYPSLKPLTAWVEDLRARTQMLDDWVVAGCLPDQLWISGLFFPQSFLTAVKQDYARKFGYPIDKVSLDAEVSSKSKPPTSTAAQADAGHWVTGLFLEGASWADELQHLVEPRPGVREEPLPPILIKPRLEANWPRHASDFAPTSLYTQTLPLYDCPVYRTGERKGTLSTTGHSTNFVMSIPLPSSLPPRHWVKRGAAIVLATAD
jgi:dynein heavy chain